MENTCLVGLHPSPPMLHNGTFTTTNNGIKSSLQLNNSRRIVKNYGEGFYLAHSAKSYNKSGAFIT